jgi:hypothetical protein
MHPVEQLRAIARARRAEPADLAASAALALGQLAEEDPPALVAACRRLVARQPACGPLWWVCAHLLVAFDPASEAEILAEELWCDPTLDLLDEMAGDVPGGVLIGGIRIGVPAGAREGVRGGAKSARGVHRSSSRAVSRSSSRSAQLAHAAATEVAAVPVEALGPSGVVLCPDSEELLESATDIGLRVWLVAGVGRMLPQRMFEALAARAGIHDLPANLELVVTRDGPIEPAMIPPTCGAACPEPAAMLGNWRD